MFKSKALDFVLNDTGSVCVAGLYNSSAHPSEAVLQIVVFDPPPLAQLCFWAMLRLFPWSDGIMEGISTNNNYTEIGPKTRLQWMIEKQKNRLAELNTEKIKYLERKENLLLYLRAFASLIRTHNSAPI